jgi:hypothetical protein
MSVSAVPGWAPEPQRESKSRPTDLSWRVARETTSERRHVGLERRIHESIDAVVRGGRNPCFRHRAGERGQAQHTHVVHRPTDGALGSKPLLRLGWLVVTHGYVQNRARPNANGPVATTALFPIR